MKPGMKKLKKFRILGYGYLLLGFRQLYEQLSTNKPVVNCWISFLGVLSSVFMMYRHLLCKREYHFSKLY